MSTAALFDRDSCGGLIVRGIPGSDGSDLTCQRCWPEMVPVKRCNNCFDPLPRFDYAVDANGDPFCRECERGLKHASTRRRSP